MCHSLIGQSLILTNERAHYDFLHILHIVCSVHVCVQFGWVCMLQDMSTPGYLAYTSHPRKTFSFWLYEAAKVSIVFALIDPNKKAGKIYTIVLFSRYEGLVQQQSFSMKVNNMSPMCNRKDCCLNSLAQQLCFKI